jgi:hypothetical protein
VVRLCLLAPNWKQVVLENGKNFMNSTLLKSWYITNSMEVIPSWDTTSCAVTQEFPNILWNPKVHYHVRMRPFLVNLWSQINPVHTPHPISLGSILILPTHLRLGLSSGFFHTNILYAFLFSPIRATYPAHLIRLELIQITLHELYKLQKPQTVTGWI